MSHDPQDEKHVLAMGRETHAIHCDPEQKKHEKESALCVRHDSSPVSCRRENQTQPPSLQAE